jgi:hypothetical protein
MPPGYGFDSQSRLACMNDSGLKHGHTPPMPACRNRQETTMKKIIILAALAVLTAGQAMAQTTGPTRGWNGQSQVDQGGSRAGVR